MSSFRAYLSPPGFVEAHLQNTGSVCAPLDNSPLVATAVGKLRKMLRDATLTGAVAVGVELCWHDSSRCSHES
jgi:hypothetical protein